MNEFFDLYKAETSVVKIGGRDIKTITYGPPVETDKLAPKITFWELEDLEFKGVSWGLNAFAGGLISLG